MLGGGRLHGLIDRTLEPFDAVRDVIDFVQIVQACGLLRRLLELHLSDPRQVPLAPRRHGRRGTAPVPQQKFPQAVPRAQLILLRRLPGAHQVTQRLVRGVRYPHRRQVTGPIAPR